MGPVRATFGRTIGRVRSLFSSSFAVAGFMAMAAVAFARQIETADGGQLTLPVLLAISVAPALPALAAFLGMDVWSDERLTGRLDMLLTVAVSERDFVFGKFLGVFACLMAVVGLFMATSLALLRLFAPDALSGVTFSSLAIAMVALALQGLLWSALTVAASSMFRHAASAACVVLMAAIAVPRGLWFGLMAWSQADRTHFGEMPLDAHVVDISSGVVPLGTVALYLALTALALLVATKCVVAYRLVGRGAKRLRLSTGVTLFLSAALACLTVGVFVRFNPVVDLSVIGTGDMLSPRTQSILAETSGRITITAFLPRKDKASRSIGRLLRTLRRRSEAVGGARIELRFVDPQWDIGMAEHLLRRGASKDSIVFESGRRMMSIAVNDGCSERVCAAAIRRISSPSRSRNVYWTVGHGESRFDDYGTFGMSDIARDLFREGFGNSIVDLSSNQPIPADCAMLLVAGARDDFSRAEMGRLNSFLHEGGRLLVLLASAKAGGAVSLLPSWGMRLSDAPLQGVKTVTGTDVIVSSFTDHPIAAPLKGSRIILDRPVSISPSAVAESGTGVDRIDYSPVAEADSVAVVAAVERGGGAGADLALRPTRIVVLGDASFALNGQLAARASANRDFFLNCVSYLTGSEAHGSGEAGADTFVSGMDRASRLQHVIASAVAVPALVFAILLLVGWRRKVRA